MYGSFNHLRKVRLLTPAARAKADLLIAFMLFILHFSFKDSIITGPSSDTLLTMPYVDHLIPCRICHFPSVALLRRPVAVVIVVEREGLGARLGSCLPDLILLCRIIHCEIWIRMYKLVIFLLCSYLLRYSRSLSLIPSVPFS